MKYEQAEHCYPHPPIPTVVEAYENAFPAPERIAARTSAGLKNMAAFFVSRAERTNDVCLCAYEVADILKEAADAINKLETERDEARWKSAEEELPDEGEWVLHAYKGVRHPEYGIFARGHFMRDGGPEGFPTTHWMRVPYIDQEEA